MKRASIESWQTSLSSMLACDVRNVIDHEMPVHSAFWAMRWLGWDSGLKVVVPSRSPQSHTVTGCVSALATLHIIVCLPERFPLGLPSFWRQEPEPHPLSTHGTPAERCGLLTNDHVQSLWFNGAPCDSAVIHLGPELFWVNCHSGRGSWEAKDWGQAVLFPWWNSFHDGLQSISDMFPELLQASSLQREGAFRFYPILYFYKRET